MGQQEIKRVRFWGESRGEVTNKFHQGLPDVDKRLQPLRKECKDFAICYALCVKWLIDQANGQDFWSRIYDMSGKINKDAIDKLANRQLLATNLYGEVADMERRFAKHGIAEAQTAPVAPPRRDLPQGTRPVAPPRRDLPQGARPIAPPRRDLASQAQVATAGVQLAAKVVRSLSSIEPVFQTIRISYADSAEAAGHMMAAVVRKPALPDAKQEKATPPILFFDPNFGEYAFADADRFKEFFDKGLWPVYAELHKFDAYRVRCFNKSDPELSNSGN